MSLSRRSFLARSAAAAGTLILLPSCDANPPTSDELLLNHVGFTPSSAKTCVLAGTVGRPFQVVNIATARVVHEGTLQPRKGDHGDYLVGDFSDVKDAGEYRLQSNDARSGPFRIDNDTYLPAIRNSINYFAVQRCGDSTSGYHAPCHLDDGIRDDDHKTLNVTGGWHDACDVRKWVDATLYGMIGLSRTLEALGPQRVDRERMIDEMRWGNRYFLAMQDAAGFVMNYCGGDDGNRFTDNKRSKDDRRIHTEPAEMTAQFNFVMAQSAMARLTRDSDLEYSKTCENAAGKALSWCSDRGLAHKAATLGAAVIACAEMHRAVGGVRPRELAVQFLKALLALQIKDDPGARGAFLARAGQSDPSREIMDGNLPLLALCEAIARFQDGSDVDQWRTALSLHVDHLLAMSTRSAFGTIPFGLYAAADPGGGRRIGKYFYRWFMKTAGEYRDDDWWVGINAHLASHGVGLLKTAKLLNRPDLAGLAQRQLDWILGANPFNASTVTGVGRNQPALFKSGEFKPTTPLIPGGVMNGLGGMSSDDVCINSGSWNTCEYWTPMVAYTMWLMSELLA